jgi:hypothetical protein
VSKSPVMPCPASLRATALSEPHDPPTQRGLAAACAAASRAFRLFFLCPEDFPAFFASVLL